MATNSAADPSSDGDSSSDLYGSPRADEAVDPARTPSGKRKSESQSYDMQQKKIRVDLLPAAAGSSSQTPFADFTYHGPPGSRPVSRPNPAQPLPGTWNSSRPGSVVSTIGFPGPSGSANPTNQRNQQEAKERKVARKAEIERRCRELDPPLLPKVLTHMSSYQAAMQIGIPLNDQAWETLKPKLLDERPAAEAIVREEDRVIADAKADVEQIGDSKVEHRPTLKDTKEAESREWAAAQAPVRDRLGPIAEEFIRTHWDNGRAVTQENSPQFAADCLIQVRRRYFSYGPPEYDAPPNEPLVLDAMKWIYDNKIKPIAEVHRKELFACPDCDSGMKAFEGCIQHYAAKHTGSLSQGTRVVAWQTAVWPETPPFSSDPRKPKQLHLSQPPPPLPGYPTSYSLGQTAYYPAAYSNQPVPAPGYPPLPPTHFHQPYPGVHHGLQYSHQTSPPPYVNSANPEHFQYQRGPYNAPSYPSYVPPTSPAGSHYAYHNPPPQYVSGQPYDFSQAPYVPAHSPPSSGYPYAPPVHLTAKFYDSQRDEFARHANEFWLLLADVKDIPPSVRVYTVMSQAVSIFCHQFRNEPSLELVMDSIISNPLMTSLKNANGLACKTCVLYNEDLEDPHSSALQFSSGGRKLYSFNSLLQHFKNVHVDKNISRNNSHGDSETSARLDWKEDMIELPKDSVVAGLVNARNMDATKLRVLAEAFPTIFPNYVVRRPSSGHSGPHDNEYDPRNPLIVSSGRRSRSSDNAQGRVRVGQGNLAYHSSSFGRTNYVQQRGGQDDRSRSPHPDRPNRNMRTSQEPSQTIVKLDDGMDYELVPVAPQTGSHRDRSPAHYVRVASDPRHRSAVDSAAHFLNELEVEPRHRKLGQHTSVHSIGQEIPSSVHKAGISGAKGDYDVHPTSSRTQNTAFVSRTAYHDNGPGRHDTAGHAYVSQHSRVVYSGPPGQEPSIKRESPVDTQTYAYHDGHPFGASRG